MELLVIGLDGATYSVIEPLINDGHLPNIKEAIYNGCHGVLESTLPPVTALAWPSFFTGLNPGNHGLLSWQLPLNKEFKRPLNNSLNVTGNKLWQILNHNEKIVYVVNVPVTYPPEPIIGGMITGMLTPNLAANFTFPNNLKQDLLQVVPNYQLDIDIQKKIINTSNTKSIISFLRESRKVTRARGQAIQWLIKNKAPDVLIAVFEIPDRIQHILWKQIENISKKDHNVLNSRIEEELILCFKCLDDEFGSIQKLLPSSGNLMVLSDHGFGKIHTTININEWLVDRGLLEYKKSEFIFWDFARKLGSALKYVIPSKILWKTKTSLPVYKNFDWDHTIAYSGLPTEQGIFINLKGREPNGVVLKKDYEKIRSKIIEDLKKWVDHRNGSHLFSEVYRREEVYNGRFIFLAPDIVLKLSPGYSISDTIGKNHDNFLQDVSDSFWGGHEMNGIIAFNGPGVIKRKKLTYSNIIDAMPTLLYMMGLPIPQDLDGKVLVEAFTTKHRTDFPPTYQLYQNLDKNIDKSSYSINEEELVKDRLKKLGYL